MLNATTNRIQIAKDCLGQWRAYGTPFSLELVGGPDSFWAWIRKPESKAQSLISSWEGAQLALRAKPSVKAVMLGGSLQELMDYPMVTSWGRSWVDSRPLNQKERGFIEGAHKEFSRFKEFLALQ